MEILKIGDKLKDNDPRMGNRILTVVELDECTGRVVVQNAVGMKYRHWRHRIFTDGKERKSGLSLVRAQI